MLVLWKIKILMTFFIEKVWLMILYKSYIFLKKFSGLWNIVKFYLTFCSSKHKIYIKDHISIQFIEFSYTQQFHIVNIHIKNNFTSFSEVPSCSHLFNSIYYFHKIILYFGQDNKLIESRISYSVTNQINDLVFIISSQYYKIKNN